MSYQHERKKRDRKFQETKDDLTRGLNDMKDLLKQAVWILAIIAILLLAIFLGGLTLIMVAN